VGAGHGSKQLVDRSNQLAEQKARVRTAVYLERFQLCPSLVTPSGSFRPTTQSKTGPHPATFGTASSYSPKQSRFSSSMSPKAIARDPQLFTIQKFPRFCTKPGRFGHPPEVKLFVYLSYTQTGTMYLGGESGGQSGFGDVLQHREVRESIVKAPTHNLPPETSRYQISDHTARENLQRKHWEKNS
jgi:hypothetical protein